MKKIIYGNDKNIIHGILKLSRVKSGLSQSQLAAKMQTMDVNMDQQMISKIENNARIVTDYELACFCVILNITPEEILADFSGNLKNILK